MLQVPGNSIRKCFRWVKARETLREINCTSLGCEMSHNREDCCAYVGKFAGNRVRHSVINSRHLNRELP